MEYTAHTLQNIQDQVTVTTAGVEIPDGDTGASEDLTLMNGRVILKFATKSQPPWGMPPGGVLDMAPVAAGRPQADLINLFDFLPDNWCSWPNTYHRIQAVETGPKLGVVSVERDWGDVHLKTVYTLEQGSNTVHVSTSMTHTGKKPLDDISPGYTLYLKKGHMFTPPGLNGQKEGAADAALTWSFIGYGENWSIALHAPYVRHIDHFGQDMFGRLSLQPGESKTVQAWIQVCPHSDISEILAFELEKRGVPSGTVTGQVFDDNGTVVDNPFVLVSSNGHPLTWCRGKQGRYSLSLPQGDYTLQATAKHYSQSPAQEVHIGSGNTEEKDFSGLQPPAHVSFQVRDSRDHSPLDACISIAEGPAQVIGFLGQSRYFTELERPGFVQCDLPPGDYLFHVSHGAGFIALPAEVRIELQASQSRHLDVDIDLAVNPAAYGWYGADLHHHGDILDGVTPPEAVLRSQLAAGLNLAFLSDHDSSAKNGHMADLAASRGVPFIPAMEISPAWGHFNIYPVDSEAVLGIDPGTSTAGEIFTHARSLGAEIVVVNHPYSTYGYFRSLDLGVAPGGYVENFDLLELNFQYTVEETLHAIWELWNQGHRVYLTAGTDTHSIWQDTSGAVRMYAYIEGEPTPGGYIAALKAGNSFATFGPLVFPDIVFGNEVRCQQGQPMELAYDIRAVHGIKSVQFIHNAQVVETIEERPQVSSKRVCFQTQPEGNSWYALVVTDHADKRAFTNPVWVICE